MKALPLSRCIIQVKLWDNGIVTALDELIQVRNFIESGWFIVERVEEYDRKKHPKVLRKINGSMLQGNAN